MTPLRIVPWVLLVCLWAFALATLPTSVERWWFVPIIATASLAFITALTLSLPKYPQLFNFPEKERFLRLPIRFRDPVHRAMQTTLDATATVMMLMLGTAHYIRWRIALGDDAGAMHLVILLGAVASTPLVLILVSRVSAATEAAERRWKDAGSPAA